MIGISLPPGALMDSPQTDADKALLDQYGGAEKLLCGLKAQGAGAIELRSVRPDTPAAVTAACADKILSAGLGLTIHATLTDTDAAGFFAPLRPALRLAPPTPRPIPLTVHSLRTGSEPLDQAATVRRLRQIADRAADEGLNVVLALENNRIHRSGLSIMDTLGVAATVREAARTGVGACFDLGHLYSNFLTWPECTPFMPAEEFLRATVHTHIHGVMRITHCPLTEDSLPLEDYLGALIRAGYNGIYNLELECGRFWREIPPREGFEMSIRALKACLGKLGVKQEGEE